MKMNKQDLVQLNNISFLGKQKCPAIHLLCAFIAKWHFGLMFLSPLGDQQKSDFPQLFPDQGAVAFYHQETSRFVEGQTPVPHSCLVTSTANFSALRCWTESRRQ
ncbi:hypothetical protein BASA81_000758 [Batrachochytrium salamandrivorans]|nr:hypothetical protein BASA81_000758 [Batrachochytrium salamandrivorans]